MTNDTMRGTYSIWVVDGSGRHKDGGDIADCDLAWAKTIGEEVFRSVASRRGESKHPEINPATWPFRVQLAMNGSLVAEYDGNAWKLL